MLHNTKFFLFIILLLIINPAYSANNNPITVNAIMTDTYIQLIPNSIPENTPFIIHVINKTGIPVELENSDTSVEVYTDMDKTFKVGLTVGSYIFFNDFNPHTKTATLFVKTAAELANANANHFVPNLFISTTSNEIATKNSSPSKDTAILFIVWRESVEALLVVGVVYSWLKQLKAGRKSGMFFLWIGVAVGLIFAILLSFLLVSVKDVLSPNAAYYFQAAMTFVAALMIVYMVKWMRQNGRTLKSGMHNALEKNASTRWRNISILTVVAVAFAREASEAVIFINALGFAGQGESTLRQISIMAIGVMLAIITIYLLQLGNKIFSWQFFFKITEVLLLLLGGGLLLNCIDLLISSGFLPALYTKVWDTSFFLANGGFLTPLISSFTGYRATPSLMDVIIYGTYWVFIYLLLRSKKGIVNAS
jgi:high-affinity iron transporter